MRDAEIYRLNNETRQQLGMKIGMLELIAKEALYQVAALVSLIVSIPYIGYFFKKIMNKRIAILKGVIKQKSYQEQEYDQRVIKKYEEEEKDEKEKSSNED